MFTGLIETLGRLKQRVQRGEDTWLGIESSLPSNDIALGDSIAVNGACLTVVELSDGYFAAQTSPETLRRTNLGALRSGDPVNLERALALGARLGGHLVLGHVDGTGRIVARQREGNAVILSVEAEPAIVELVVEKGSVALDGVSLTINRVDARGFSVAVVPFTRGKVALLERPSEWRVNIETDILGKYVARLLGRSGHAQRAEISLELLQRAGFAPED